ncbi:hypothetical protein K1719_001783 [Acacia pycnantha]|nr:hypothetical protein K1719_001783 [Acacia pycnantha]
MVHIWDSHKRINSVIRTYITCHIHKACTQMGSKVPNQPKDNMHGRPLENHHEFKAAFPKIEDVDFRNGSQVDLSPSQDQQKSALPHQSNQNIPAGISSVQMPRVFLLAVKVDTSKAQSQQSDSGAAAVKLRNVGSLVDLNQIIIRERKKTYKKNKQNAWHFIAVKVLAATRSSPTS